VVTSRRGLFEDLIRQNEGTIRRFDGFLLHPAVFDSGWVYLPSNPSIREPVPVIRGPGDYDELSTLGPLDYALKVHREKKLMPDLGNRLKESPSKVAGFVEEIGGWGVAFYCGAMGVTPVGYLSYFRGLNETLKDMARDQQAVYNVAMDIAGGYSRFIAEYARSCRVPRAWISFANATPAVVGDYCFGKVVWPSAKALIEGIIREGVTPIVQFDEEVRDLRFLTQLPRGSLIVHVSGDSDLIRDAGALSGFACVAGNFRIPADEAESRRIREVSGAVGTGRPGNLIISTDGGSPFILAGDNAPELSLLGAFRDGGGGGRQR